MLARLEKVAQTYAVNLQGEILQARDVGTAIVDEAAERRIDLIIMGLGYKRKFGEFDLGQTAPVRPPQRALSGMGGARRARGRDAGSNRAAGAAWPVLPLGAWLHVRDHHGLRPGGGSPGADARRRRPRGHHHGLQRERLRTRSGSDFKGTTLLGSGVDQEILRRAGIERADAFVAATQGDNRNIMASQIAKHCLA